MPVAYADGGAQGPLQGHLTPTPRERERWHTVWLLAHRVRESGPKIFFADEAHFWADAELRGKWVLKGKPALMDSNQPASPRRGEKTDYYSAVCPETREVEWMELEGKQQRGDFSLLPDATEGEALRAIECDLGKRASASRRSVAGVPTDARTGSAAGEPALPTARTSTLTGRSGVG